MFKFYQGTLARFIFELFLPIAMLATFVIDSIMYVIFSLIVDIGFV